MNNPLRILQTLDRHLTTPAEMTIFGRAALALGYPGSPAAFATTHDVDAILPLSWLAVFRPSTLDLILTKLERGDENDLTDVCFLLRQKPLTREQFRSAFQRARMDSQVPSVLAHLRLQQYRCVGTEVPKVRARRRWIPGSDRTGRRRLEPARTHHRVSGV